jgi:hypothetical protein
MGKLTFQNAPMTFLITILTELNGRPVLNQTGLTGHYDFTLQWTLDQTFRRAEAGNEPAAQPDPSGPSLFTALQQQLGLKLEPGKGPVQVLVIDHVERLSRELGSVQDFGTNRPSVPNTIRQEQNAMIRAILGAAASAVEPPALASVQGFSYVHPL